MAGMVSPDSAGDRARDLAGKPTGNSLKGTNTLKAARPFIGSWLVSPLVSAKPPMNTEEIFDIILWTLLASGLTMRSGFAFRVWRTGERLLPDRAAKEREGWPARSIEGLFTLLAVALIVNFCFPGDRLRALRFPAPPWLRWTGLALGVASMGLFGWTHVALGKFWSTCLQLRAGHRLITAGPYARIRHPMYTAILGWMAGLALVAGSWVPLVFAGLAALNFLLRIRPEEKMMLQAFGDEYREYMKQTGRFLRV